MRKLLHRLGAGLYPLMLLTATASAGEQKVALDTVPKAVIDAVKTRFSGGTMTAAALEEDDEGKPVYEVSLQSEGQNIDVILTPEGALRLIEKTLDARDLPKAVADTLASRYPKAKYTRFEEVVKVEEKNEKLDYYEALLETAKKQKIEVMLSADGKILKEE